MSEKENKIERVYYPKPKDFIPESHFPEGHKRAGKKRCASWSKTRGEQCGNIPNSGKNVCRMHNAKAKSGKLNGNYKHGKFVKDLLPGDYQEIYERIASNPNLVEINRQRIEASYTIEMKLMQDLGSGNSGNIFQELATIYTKAEAATGNVDLFLKLFQEIGKLIEDGVNRYDTLDEIRKQQTHTNKLVKDEGSRLGAIPIDQMVAVMKMIDLFYQESIMSAVPRDKAMEIIDMAQLKKNKFLLRQTNG